MSGAVTPADGEFNGHPGRRGAAGGSTHRSSSSASGSMSMSGGAATPSGGSGSNSLLTIVKAQVSFLLSTLTEDNFSKNRSDINTLIDQHGSDAQSHYLRRLIVACASHYADTSSLPSPTSVSSAQSGLYLRLLQLEIARLAADPATVDKVGLALQTGFNDSSASTSDTFKSLDLQRFLKTLSLQQFAETVLLCEISQLSSPEQQVGGRSASPSALAARNGLGFDAMLQLRDPPSRFTSFLAQLYEADLSSTSWSRLLALFWSFILCNSNPDRFPVDSPYRDSDETCVPVTHQAEIRKLIPNLITRSGFDAVEQIVFDAVQFTRTSGNSMAAGAARFIGKKFSTYRILTQRVMTALFRNFSPQRPSDWTESSTIRRFLICLVLRLPPPVDNSLNMQAIVDAIDSFVDGDREPLDWPAMIQESLEYGDYSLEDQLPNIRAMLSATSKMTGSAPVNLLLATPGASGRQYDIIELLVLSQFNFATPTLSSEGLVISREDFDENAAFNDDLDDSVRNLIIEQIDTVRNSTWNNSQLLPALMKLLDQEYSLYDWDLDSRARNLVDVGSQRSPDLVFIAMLKHEITPSATTIHLSSRLLRRAISAEDQSPLILYWMAVNDRTVLLSKLREFYEETELNALRILEIAQDYRILRDIVANTPDFYTLDIAAVASTREYLNLERWLENAIHEHGNDFVKTALNYIGYKVRQDLARQENNADPDKSETELAKSKEPTTVTLSAETLATFLRTFRSHRESFMVPDVDFFNDLRAQCMQLHSRLMDFGSDAKSDPDINVCSFSHDIETEVSVFYQRMYQGEISVDDVVTLLRNAKDSGSTHDHDFLACSLHMLFDEYKYFAIYPHFQLTLAAQLMGSLINFRLIDGIPLSIAVRYVLDALRHLPDSSWFLFGIQALLRFLPRLHEWPYLAQAILSVEHLSHSHPEVAAIAAQALEAQEAAPDEDALERLKTFRALKPDVPSYKRGTVEAPPVEASDGILFIVNNLAPINMEEKVAAVLPLLETSLHRWFANYLVDQRVSLEPNNHQLYMTFLDAINNAALNKEILQETFVRADDLLNSEQTVQSSNQRTLLKNIAMWLGALTLAKNKPLKHKNISFKDLLIQGYEADRLIVAIPFVCKILDQCAKSRIFKSPNPWLVAILRLLVELYQFADLKLNLKFEIEVLFKNLNLEIKDVNPTTTLRDRPIKDANNDLSAAEPQLLTNGTLNGTSFDQSGANGDLTSSQAARASQPPSGIALLGSSSSGGAAGYSLALADAITAALANVPQHLVFSPQVASFANDAALKKIVQVGIDNAVREIIAPVAERSVTIAGISTRELTIKDFAMEGSEERMRDAAHLMVQNLAGSLALVTCKEPLRLSIVTHIRTLLLQHGFTEQRIPEQAIMILANNNLELACSVVEKVAMDRAVVEVDDSLAPAYIQRLKHRERSNQAFWDTAAMAASHYSGMLPDPLRLKLGGLQPSQLRVYEEFVKRPSVTSSQESDASNLSADMAAATAALLSNGSPAEASVSAQQASDIFVQAIADLDAGVAAAESAGMYSLNAIPSDNIVQRVVRQLPAVAARSVTKDDTTLTYSQKIVQMLYRSESALARQVFVALLQQLCELVSKVHKDVSNWLIYAPDERKFNVPVTILLMEAEFINIAEFDTQLAKFVLKDFKSSTVNFATRLVRECVLGERHIVLREQVAQTIQALAEAVNENKGGELASALISDLRAMNTAAIEPAVHQQAAENGSLREQLAMCFIEWVRIHQSSPNMEKSFVDFVVQLQRQGILRGEEISHLFFRVCTEVSIEAYIKQKAAGGNISTGLFQPVDAFARLVTFMVKYHADPQNKSNEQAKVHYMSKVLSIVVLVLAQSHEELGPHFQQKPFYRFFSSLLSNLNAIEQNLGAAYYQCLVALSHSVHTLQPAYFSGFTFSWMALISHRMFMPKLLAVSSSKDREGWSSFHRLLISLLRFLSPFLRNGEMTDSIRTVYMGTLRLMLVLLHDYPEFLSAYYYSLNDAIPAGCTQLQNLISSAFPASVKLPDPLAVSSSDKSQFLPSLLLSDYAAPLQQAGVRQMLEQALATQAQGDLMCAEFADKVIVRPVDNRMNGHSAQTPVSYNESLLAAVAMYAASHAINQSMSQSDGGNFQLTSRAVSFLQGLVDELEPEGSYLLLNSMAVHLRHPNTHSQWFSQWFVHTFASASTKEYTKEQIVRVLLERLVAYRPHPYNIIATFVQIMQDEGFANYSFVNKSPQVKLILGNIKASISAAASASAPLASPVDMLAAAA